jgi:hypothetical protein
MHSGWDSVFACRRWIAGNPHTRSSEESAYRVVPIWTGVLLLTNYAVFMFVGSCNPSGRELRHAANELKETVSAVILAWIAWVVFQNERGAELDWESQSVE